MRVLLVTSEVFPIAKTGGLADFCWAISKALSVRGCDVRVLLPAYPDALEALEHSAEIRDLMQIPGYGVISLWEGRLPGSHVRVWLVDSPRLYDRAGSLYQDTEGRDWPDNGMRFGLLSRVGAMLAVGDGPVDWRADVVHLNDWQAGPVAPLLKTYGDKAPPMVFTIHNMAFQGLFASEILPFLGLPQEMYASDELEFHGQISYLKAGIRYADRLTTVSRRYAEEILTPEFGSGLDGLLQRRKNDLTGITNGIDYDVWNPARDSALPVSYSFPNLAPKTTCKTYLRATMGLMPQSGRPLLGYMSRLTHQKMVDVLIDALPEILDLGVQIVVHGKGDRATEEQLRQLAGEREGEMVFRAGYDERLAHQIIAGTEILLAPARFEPCGLVQMYAMRYGTIPIVTRVGGLAETVTDATHENIRAGTATGFVFDEFTPEALIEAVRRAVRAYRRPLLWRQLQQIAMAEDNSWGRSAKRYIAIYEELLRRSIEDDPAE